MQPLISIVVPIYNVEIYLENCLKSIIGQTYKNLEIILINDGSSDSSGEICNAFERLDKRVRVVHNTNHGVSYSRNLGIDMATGSRILFIDSDDTVESNYVEKLVEPLKQYNYDLVICNINDVYTQKNKVKSRRFPQKLTGNFNDDFADLLQVPILAGPVCKLYNANILKENHIKFDVNISFGEDFLFNLSYYKYVKSYRILRIALYNYFHRPVVSLMSNRSNKNYYNAIKVLRTFRMFLLGSDISNKDVALTYMTLSYIRYFSKVTDGDNSYEGFKKRISVFREILDGMYGVLGFRKLLKVILLKYNLTYILYKIFK